MARERTYTRDFKRSFLRCLEQTGKYHWGSSSTDYLAYLFLFAIGFFQIFDYRQTEDQTRYCTNVVNTMMFVKASPPEPG